VRDPELREADAAASDATTEVDVDVAPPSPFGK
jgi:hypothetical protein